MLHYVILGAYFPQWHASTKIALHCILLSVGGKVHIQRVIFHSLFQFYAATGGGSFRWLPTFTKHFRVIDEKGLTKHISIVNHTVKEINFV